MTQEPPKDQQAEAQKHLIEQQTQAEEEAIEEQERLQEEEISDQQQERAQESAAAAGILPIVGLYQPKDKRTLEQVAEQQADMRARNKSYKAGVEVNYFDTLHELNSSYEGEKNKLYESLKDENLTAEAENQARREASGRGLTGDNANNYVATNSERIKNDLRSNHQNGLRQLADEKYGRVTVDPTGKVILHQSYEDQARENVFRRGIRGHMARNEYRKRENRYINPNLQALHNRINNELNERFAIGLTDQQRNDYYRSFSLSNRDQERIKKIAPNKRAAETEKIIERQRKSFLKTNKLEDSFRNEREGVAKHQMEVFKQRSSGLMKNPLARISLRAKYGLRAVPHSATTQRLASIPRGSFQAARGFAQAQLPRISTGLSNGINGAVSRMRGLRNPLRNPLFQKFTNFASKPASRMFWYFGIAAMIVIIIISYFSSMQQFTIQEMGPMVTTKQGTGYCSPDSLLPYFGNETDASIASCICQYESSSLPNDENLACLVGGTADYSIGLFQINLISHCPGALNYSDATKVCSINNSTALNNCVATYIQPENNIKEAVALRNARGNWEDWHAEEGKCF